ncbi:hypothetical protein TNCV_3856081 [Trichonephila clavipes]|nr:hypothetical protein TNCV_3856081 [Trichonephila clavipes]
MYLRRLLFGFHLVLSKEIAHCMWGTVDNKAEHNTARGMFAISRLIDSFKSDKVCVLHLHTLDLRYLQNQKSIGASRDFAGYMGHIFDNGFTANMQDFRGIHPILTVELHQFTAGFYRQSSFIAVLELPIEKPTFPAF